MKRLCRSAAFLVVIAFSFWWLLGCSSAPAQPQPTSVPPAAQPTAAKPPAEQPTAAPAAATTPAAQPAAKPAVPTGALRLAASALGNEAMDPISAISSNKAFFELMFDSLVALGADGDFDPKVSLAEKWDVAPDSTSYTFYIRKGAKFHNGDDLTAEDVKFSVERMMSEKSKTSFVAALRQNIAKVEVVDPYTVRFQMKAPYIFLLATLSNASGNEGLVMPKNYIETVGDAAFATKPVGSGPYKFVDYRKGDYLKLEAVDKHWKVSVPKYKEVNWRIIPEEGTRAALLQRGDVDIIDVSPRGSKDLEKAGFKRYVKPGGQSIVFNLHNQWEPPFNDVRVRQAVNIAIDRQAINESIFEGLGDPSGNFPMTVADIAYKTKVPAYPYDPAKARDLLKEAGASNLKLKLYSFSREGVPEAPRMVEAVASMWKAVGANVQITASDAGAYRDTWGKKALAPGDVGFIPSSQVSIAGPISSLIGLDSALPTVVDAKAIELRGLVLASKSLDEYKQRAVAMQKHITDNYLWAPIADLGAVHVAAPSINDWRLPAKEFQSWGLTGLVTQ